jgi:hypothetical protein
MKICIGAYAASPSANGFDIQTESLYYEGLRSFRFVSGLEIPFLGTLHSEPNWFLDQLSPQWDSVLTPIPGVMNTLAKDAHFGLASDDAGGRGRALEFMNRLLESVAMINRHVGRQAIRAVEVHSAPTLGRSGVCGSIESFAESLTEMRGWDWQGAQLVVEHCDAYKVGQVPAKGFLTLEAEMAAITQSSGMTPVGVLVNWGRSAIETRSGDGPEEHLKQAAAKGLLKGLIFSGATTDSALYGNWSDSHAPFETAGTQLTAARAEACIRIADAAKLPVFGLKMQALPKSLTVAERLAFLEQNAAWCLRLMK